MLYHSLNFASDVAYYVNIMGDEMNSDFDIYFETDTHYMHQWYRVSEPSYIMTWYDGYNERMNERYLPREVALFILTGKELPGGLCTPMQRYLAYRGLARKEAY